MRHHGVVAGGLHGGKSVNLTAASAAAAVAALSVSVSGNVSVNLVATSTSAAAHAISVTGNSVSVPLVAVAGTCSSANIAVSSGPQITTITLNNTSGASETPMWSKFFGLAFTDSDATGLPLSGGNATYPVFKYGSTVIPYTVSNPSFHSSGRIRHAMFCLLLGGNVTVGNNFAATITVNQSNNTSAPSASGRSTSDFSSANLQVLATELDGPNPGSYVANLLTGVTDNLSYNYVWADGPAGKVWAIASQFKNGTTPEGNLWCIWYVASMQDSSGNFGGVRLLGSITIPVADATRSTLAFRSFSALTLQSGSTVLRDLTAAANRPQTGTCDWAGSGASSYLSTTSNNYIETNLAFRVSMVGGTGTLPTGISANTTYYAYNGSYFTPPYSSFQVNTATGGTAPIFMSSHASGGTMQYTLLPALWPCCRIHTAGPTGQWDYVQGGGSVASLSGMQDTNLQVERDMSYAIKTLTIPPYDLTASVTSGSQTPFYINGNCGLTTFPGAGGLDGHIGMLPVPTICHVYNQLLTDEYNVRSIGLAGGQGNGCVRPSSNGYRLVPWNNGTNGAGTQYSQMGTLQWANNMGGSLGTTSIYQFAQASDYANNIGQAVGEGTHQTSYSSYAYWLTGEPQFCDMMLEWANGALGGRYCGSGPTYTRIDTTQYQPYGDSTYDGSAAGSRNVHSNGTLYYDMFQLSSAGREDAWFLRNLAYAWSLMPKSHPQCTAYWTYFGDVLRDNFAWVASVIAQSPSTYASTNGLFNPQGETVFLDVWQQSGYWLEAISHYYGISADSNALSAMNKTILWTEHVYNTFGANAISNEEWLVRTNYYPTGTFSAGGGPLITSDAQFGLYRGSVITNWTSGSANFNFYSLSTDPNNPSAYVPTVGDTVYFAPPNPSAQETSPIPAAFTAYTPYYIVSATSLGSGNYTVTLSASLGGSAISNTDNITNQISAFIQSASKLNAFDSNSATDYPSVTYRSILYAKSRGATTDAATLADMASRCPTNAAYSTEPNFCFAGSV